MPNLFECLGYKIYFWSNENSEPIHVHISKGVPTPHSTKVWLTKSGGCIVANNDGKISTKELNNLMEAISINYFFIVAEWKNFFGVDEVKFYC